ncbi:HET-domain-containing protein, partial [Ophiobolus disseminans]
SPYSHLDTQKGQIRLAVLAPGSYDDVLVIRLQTDNLFEIIAPDYEALSYVWGQDLSTQKALVNDIAVTITANLDCALRHLRYQYKHRTLWIDALCINQADALERNAQVQLMNRIYPSASMVVIWLGPADRDDVEAIEKIKASRPPSSTSLLRICERPWFYRVWVAQELALAHSDPVVYLGLSHLSWTTLHDLITKLCENRTSLLLEDETRRPMKLSHRLKVALWNAKALGEVRQTRSTATLFQNLCNTQRSLATDHRDKVYGVLGLS